MKKILSTALLAFITLGYAFSKPANADEMYKILDNIYRSYNFSEDFTCTLSMIIEKPNKPKEAIQYKLFRRNKKDQTCIVQIAPEADKGTGYLQEKKNLWVYNPMSHQFTHSSLKRNLGSGSAKVSDVKTEVQFSSEWDITAVSDAKIGKFPVFVVTARALKNDATYPMQKWYVRKDKHLILKVESYGASGRHMRTTLMAQYLKVKDSLLPVHQIHRNELVKGEKTTQIFSDFNISTIPDIVFTKAYLEKIN